MRTLRISFEKNNKEKVLLWGEVNQGLATFETSINQPGIWPGWFSSGNVFAYPNSVYCQFILDRVLVRANYWLSLSSETVFADRPEEFRLRDQGRRKKEGRRKREETKAEEEYSSMENPGFDKSSPTLRSWSLIRDYSIRVYHHPQMTDHL